MEYELIQGSTSVRIEKLEYDSRKVCKGDVFFALPGVTSDGHDFISVAIKNGASAIVVSESVNLNQEGITVIKVQHTRKAFALCSSNYFNRAHEKLKIIGITGTNGKTTSAFMIKRVLEEAGYKVGLLGTVANYIGSERMEASSTTPESFELHKLFRKMVDEGCEYCVMEVSSHSLYWDKVFGINFKYGIFTNLTRDHLDFHKTFEEYYKAKFKLFTMSDTCIINGDDEYGRRLIDQISKSCKSVITYGIEGDYHYKAENYNIEPRKIDYTLVSYVDSYPMSISISGKYNIYNSLEAIATCMEEKINVDVVKKAMGDVVVIGRCEIMQCTDRLGFHVILDYAHTPDGLEKILKTCKEFTEGRLIGVFGCGGDRDKTKRPIMGKIGTDICDFCVITSDNPRTEEPMEIIRDILKGVERSNYVVEENRREAIKKSIVEAKKGDVIVIAGKGHEDYQVLKTGKIHFDEHEIVEEIVKELF